MCWMCDHPGSTKQDYLDQIRTTMLKSGWVVQYVESDRTPYAYTVGLTECGLPELLVTGLSPERAARLLNRVAEHAVHEDPPTPGEQILTCAGPLIEIVELAQPDAHMYTAVAFYGADFRALQLVWADENDRWPWDAAFGSGRGGQPVLGVRVGGP